MAITFDDLVQAARAAEAAGDLDGCAACQLEMYAMVQKDRSLLRRVDTTYLRNDYFMRVLAAAAFAYDRGDGKLSEYYLTHFPPEFLAKPGTFPEHHEAFGRLAYARGAYARAAEEFSAHLEPFSQDAEAWVRFGNAQFQLRRFQRAAAAYREALFWEKSREDAAENRRLAAAMMMAPEGTPLPVLREPDERIKMDADDWEAVRRIPIFINCRDRVGCLEKLVDWLLVAGYQNLVLLDNASTYRPLLQYYERIRSERVRVVRLDDNIGHKAVWDCGILELLDVRTPYVYTDPDVLPAETCPPRFLQAFLRVLVAHPSIRKVGAALRTHDITWHDRAKTIEGEVSTRLAPLGNDMYFANIDTTFALYRNVRFYHLGPAIRMAGRYEFLHLPWYYDYDHLPEDEQYYFEHASAACSLKYYQEHPDASRT